MTRNTFDVGPLADVTAEDDDGRWTLQFVRVLHHPPEKVWSALTDPVQLSNTIAANLLVKVPAKQRLLEAPDAANPHTAAEAAALRDCVAEALAQLTPREERILRMRFGIGIGMADHTLEQVGKTFGVTRERIRQIEAKALQKLSDPARARKLLTFTGS